jgi:heptosyltransferase-1
MPPSRILVVRLGAMGDVIHALPAVVTLKRNFPSARITWVIDPKWAVLLEDNPFVDEVLPFDPRNWSGIRGFWGALRRSRFDLAVDLQGLVKSALILAASGAARRVGRDRHQAREPFASVFYTERVGISPPHAVERSLELAKGAGATRMYREFPIPEGRPEGELPAGPYVLASPLAGWASKQWPLDHYSQAAAALKQDGCTLVVNGAPETRGTLSRIAGAHVHVSGIAGLIDATRRASGVIGVDSGPLHLAAALGRPSVAIFGPTNPACNGPYGGTVTVLRDPAAVTTYKRHRTIAASMRAVGPDGVIAALRTRMAFHADRITL